MEELKFIGYGEGTKKGRIEDGEKEDYWVKGNFKGGKRSSEGGSRGKDWLNQQGCDRLNNGP